MNPAQSPSPDAEGLFLALAVELMPWDAEKYHQFQAERSAPFDDLLKLVEMRPGMSAVDLGCGTGELTRRMADALPGGRVVGIDSSPEMLERARALSRAGLQFEAGDQAALSGGYDLIFSNAALQWSEDHARLFPRLFACLHPGGQLAVQMPSNHNHISHQVYREVAGLEPFTGLLRGYNRRSPVLLTEDYARILFEQRAEEILVLERIYPHVLENADAVVDWIAGTALIPYFERLSTEGRAQFEAAIRARMRRELPGSPVFYPFKRTFISAFRPG